MLKTMILLLFISLQFSVTTAFWSETIGMVAGGTAAVVGTPVVIGALGFTAGGIAAGSAGAAMMSYFAPTAAGGVVAMLQSVGAAGIGVAGNAVLGAAGAGVGAVLGRFV